MGSALKKTDEEKQKIYDDFLTGKYSLHELAKMYNSYPNGISTIIDYIRFEKGFKNSTKNNN